LWLIGFEVAAGCAHSVIGDAEKAPDTSYAPDASPARDSGTLGSIDDSHDARPDDDQDAQPDEEAGTDASPSDAHDAADAEPPAPTTVIVLRVGDGTAPLTPAATAVFLDEIRLNGGGAARTIAMPVTANGQNQPFTMTGSAVTEGELALSGDGKYITLAGYAVAPGAASVSATTAGKVKRLVARVDAAGKVDTTTTLGGFYSANNVRGAYTPDGTQFWVSGYDPAGGLLYATLGLSTPIQLASAPQSGHSILAASGQVYATSGSTPLEGVVSVGAGMPKIAGTTITLVANSQSGFGYGFAIFDRNPSVSGLDTIYLADRRDVASGGGLQKWTFDGTAWKLVATFASGLTAGVDYVTALVTASGVVLYVTTAEAVSRLGAFTDDGVNTNPSFSPIASAAANTVFHGVAFPPR
jgi:hypothetical protein